MLMLIFDNKILRVFFFPISIIYGLIIWFRNLLYDLKIFPIYKLDNVKIFSIGNITVGGTGKTPFCKYLAQYLQNRGLKVVILSRGYKRQSQGTITVSDGVKVLVTPQQAGDEPYLLASELTTVPVVVEADRYQGALFVQQKFNPDVILLDDAFQHRRFFRDLDIVLVDATRGFGNSLLLPAGVLREPLHHLKRADLICLTRVDQSNENKALIKKIQNITDCPMIKADHKPSQLFQFNSTKPIPLSFLKVKRVILFSGIANPVSFEGSVLNLGANVADFAKFPDHHQFTSKDIAFILAKAKQHNADIILTTQKDYVRLIQQNYAENIFYYLTIEIKILAGQKILDDQIADLSQ